MEPFVRRFSQTQGRPGLPISTYLRLMYLKFRYKLGYETLVEEVSDSIAWRRFCGIGYGQRVPDASTLIKLTHKFGDEMLTEINRLIIANLRERKLVRGQKIRTDTTVIASNIHYPTDASLLFDGLRRLRQKLVKVPGIGLRLGRTMTKAKKMIFSIAQALRKRDGKSRERVKTINRNILRIVRKTVIKVKRILRRVKDPRVRGHLETTLGLTDRVADQSAERLAGGKPTDRVVSLADPGARPIVKGKLAVPVEFGRTGQVTQDGCSFAPRPGMSSPSPAGHRVPITWVRLIMITAAARMSGNSKAPAANAKWRSGSHSGGAMRINGAPRPGGAASAGSQLASPPHAQDETPWFVGDGFP